MVMGYKVLDFSLRFSIQIYVFFFLLYYILSFFATISIII